MKKTCFVICPLGPARSEIRKHSDTVLNVIVKPVLEPLGYRVQRADLLADQATIPDSVSRHVFEDDLVIADLSGCNANVFYELGKRHAWGGPTIHLTDDIARLPFDVKHHRVIQYDTSDGEGLDDVRRQLRLSVEAAEGVPLQCPYPLTPEKIVELSGATVLVRRDEGERDHYYLAERIAASECRRLFLMQRSSSLVLGPEQGWGAEKTFYNTVLEKINEGAEFLHIVSLEGIARHLGRTGSHFPHLESTVDSLAKDDDAVGIRGPQATWFFKRIHDEGGETDLKPDRQARTFLVQYADGSAEGVIVVDLGGKQSAFHLRGPEMVSFFRSCEDFYHRCPQLRWGELTAALERGRALRQQGELSGT